MAVCLAEFAVQPLGFHLRHEFGRLAQQIQARGVFDLPSAVGGHGQGDPAQDEFGVQPVAAFLEITAIGHLSDHVRCADQMAELDVARIGHASVDLREGDFVAGEMNDFAGNGRPRSEPEYRQKLVKKPRTARYVSAREFSAVA